MNKAKWGALATVVLVVALFTLDQLITADAVRSVNGQVAQTDIVADDPEATRDTEKLPRPEPAAGAPKTGRVTPSLTQSEREELQRLRREAEADCTIRQGLLKKIEDLKKRDP